MAEITKYQFLDEAGVNKLAEALLGKVNVRIGERIVTAVSATSNDKQVASAKAVYDLIAALQTADTTLDGRVTANETAIGVNTQAIADINTAQGVQDGKISDLETDLGTLEAKVDGLTHLTLETVIGDISTVTDPQTDVMYLQKDNESDKTWMLYIYQAPATDGEAGTWINVGDTEVDLSNYWTKDDADEMREALGIHDAEALPESAVTAAVETAFTNTAVDLT